MQSTDSQDESTDSNADSDEDSTDSDKDIVYPDILKNRYGDQVLSFKDKLWVIGGKKWTGRDTAEDHYDDVWSSRNGKDWERIGTFESWKKDTLLISAVFQNQMWVFANLSEESYVVSSGNGKDWTVQARNLPLNSDLQYESLVFKNKLWLLGSSKISNQSEVFSSDDGVSWKKETATAPWYSKNKYGGGANSHNAYFVLHDQMWATHVLPDQTNKVLVWSSSNGKEWHQRKELSYLTIRPPWSFDSDFTEEDKQSWNYVPLSATVFQNKVYIVGASKVAVSSDGINWSTTTTNQFIHFGARIFLTANKAFTFLTSFSLSLDKNNKVRVDEKDRVLWSDDLLNWNTTPLP